MNLWILGKYLARAEDGEVTWDFQGVFDTREKAVAACKPGYFVGPAVLNEALSDEPADWPGFFWPCDPVASDLL